MDDHDMEDPLDSRDSEVIEPLLDDLPLELHFEIYKEVFRSSKYDVDLTRLGSRKVPDWVNSLFLWQLYSSRLQESPRLGELTLFVATLLENSPSIRARRSMV
jgi:hypothetical protein